MIIIIIINSNIKIDMNLISCNVKKLWMTEILIMTSSKIKIK